MRFSIYTLTDPIKKEIFYVGCTNDLAARLREHISVAKSGFPDKKDNRILDILKSGAIPIIEEIEFSYNEKDAKSSETYWITQMVIWGFPLCNILHGNVRQRETRKSLKICVVCGKDIEGTEAKITCSSACRTALCRMIARGRKPEFWLIAKGRGQKLPSFNKKEKGKVIKDVVKNIEYIELPTNILESPIANFVPYENIKLTKEQLEVKINSINKQILDLERESCPLGQHPRLFKLSQEVEIDKLKEYIIKLKITNNVA
jgi:predicted nucleic acid-binding Zn ribbon protein